MDRILHAIAKSPPLRLTNFAFIFAFLWCSILLLTLNNARSDILRRVSALERATKIESKLEFLKQSCTEEVWNQLPEIAAKLQVRVLFDNNFEKK